MMKALNPTRQPDAMLHLLHERLCQLGKAETEPSNETIHCLQDEDNYHFHTAYQPENDGWKESIKRFGYNVVALVGNTMRFLTYLTLAILFPIGIALGALRKKHVVDDKGIFHPKNDQRDYGMVYRRAGSNMIFIADNVANIINTFSVPFTAFGARLSPTPAK